MYRYVIENELALGLLAAHFGQILNLVVLSLCTVVSLEKDRLTIMRKTAAVFRPINTFLKL